MKRREELERVLARHGVGSAQEISLALPALPGCDRLAGLAAVRREVSSQEGGWDEGLLLAKRVDFDSFAIESILSRAAVRNSCR